VNQISLTGILLAQGCLIRTPPRFDGPPGVTLATLYPFSACGAHPVNPWPTPNEFSCGKLKRKLGVDDEGTTVQCLHEDKSQWWGRWYREGGVALGWVVAGGEHLIAYDSAGSFRRVLTTVEVPPSDTDDRALYMRMDVMCGDNGVTSGLWWSRGRDGSHILDPYSAGPIGPSDLRVDFSGTPVSPTTVHVRGDVGWSTSIGFLPNGVPDRVFVYDDYGKLAKIWRLEPWDPSDDSLQSSPDAEQ